MSRFGKVFGAVGWLSSQKEGFLKKVNRWTNSSAADPMIEICNLRKSYNLGQTEVPVLKGISLRIEKGQFVAIMGPSGSGKSTLLNILGCLDVADGGEYRFENALIHEATEMELAQIRGRRFGFVFQLFNLIPRLSALRNVELPLIYSRVPKSERRQRAYDGLRIVGLENRADHSASQLSGGQQQRVAIARALVNKPAVIIADEPTGSLDSASGEEIMSLFARLNKEGSTIIMVTHEEEVAAYAQRIIRLRDGHIEREEWK